ncbi:MAG: thymidylate synthase [Candidatus Pacearchaeota archaeon]
MTEQYLEHALKILTSPYSQVKGNSKETGLISLFGGESYHDLQEGYPIVTTRKLPIKWATHELIWFLKGDTNIKYLEDNGVPYWRKDTFQHNLPKMVEEGIYPDGLKKYSNEWEEATKDFGQRIMEDETFAKKWGDAGPVYPGLWRHWPEYIPITLDNKPILKDGKPVQLYIRDKEGIDQLAEFFEKAKKNPTSKRHIISAWEVSEVPNMSLPSCHTLYQINVNQRNDSLEVKLHQRSGDYFLGIAANQAQYSDLTIILANQLGLKPGRFIHSFGDAHFYFPLGKTDRWLRENFEEFQQNIKNVKDRDGYSEVLDWMVKGIDEKDSEKNDYNHVTAILEQLSREPFPKAKREIANKPIDQLTIDDFKLIGYNSHPAIRRKMAV